MQMPTPNDQHTRLARLAGAWQGTEKMYPSQWDPAGGEATGTTRSRVDLNGFAVIADYQQQRGGQVTFSGHGVYTIDPKTNEVVLHWFDSIGQGAEIFRGGWQGDRLTLTSRSAMGHARLSYDFGTPGQLNSAMDMSPDGKQWSRLFDGVYRAAK